jgi:predicted enzyme related to lactoylglutathione lyase
MEEKIEFDLNLIKIEVRDWEGMVKFYQNVLGLTATALEPHHRYGWLRTGAITIALHGVDSAKASSRVSLQFQVEDIQAGIAYLETKGCVFFDKQLTTGENYSIAYFKDPEQNVLAIYSMGEVHT